MRIVREDVDDGNFHHGAQPHAAAHVIRKNEEGRAERTHFGQAHAVDNRGHGMFANAEVQVSAAIISGLKTGRSVKGKKRLGRRRKIGRATQQPGNILRNGVLDFAGGVARRQSLRVGRKRRQILVPSVGKLPVLHARNLIGQRRVFRAVGVESRGPRIAKTLSSLADAGLEMFVHAIGNQEFRVFGPAVISLGQLDFLFAQSASPCAAGLSCLCGEPQPMWLFTMMSVGRSVVCKNVRKPARIMSRSLASVTCVTFQP